jgi:hypothetical protein
MTNREPRLYELLILSENVNDLEENPQYTRFEEYRRIWVGLQACATDMQKWALAKLDAIAKAKN